MIKTIKDPRQNLEAHQMGVFKDQKEWNQFYGLTSFRQVGSEPFQNRTTDSKPSPKTSKKTGMINGVECCR